MGVGAATKSYAPGGKHPRAATAERETGVTPRSHALPTFGVDASVRIKLSVILSQQVVRYNSLLQGRHLDLVLSAGDVEVMVGDEECTVTSMSSTQLTCQPNVSASSHTADVFVRLTLDYGDSITTVAWA